MILLKFKYDYVFGPCLRVCAQVEVAGSVMRICIPRLSVWQYHPFSAFYDP